MQLFKELKRRNVLRVAIAYLAMSWLVAQVAQMVFESFGAPDWYMRTLLVIAAIGLPVVLVISWVFELTPGGLIREKDVDRSSSIGVATGQRLNGVIMVTLALALGYFAFDKFVLDPARDEQRLSEARQEMQSDALEGRVDTRRSIAVLPFENRNANSEEASFFSDGVHGELLTALSRIRDLKVISRTSVINYSDTTKSAPDIGKELGVSNLLSGTVQRVGGTVRIAVRLISAASDEQIWANTYDRELSAENIFAIQSEIALAITGELDATLTPLEQQALQAMPTASLGAYDAYLRGTQLFLRNRVESLREALEFAREAAGLDPQFVGAYLLQGQLHDEMIEIGDVNFAEVSAQWDQAIERALELDPDSGMAHALRAAWLWRGGQEGAMPLYEEALRLEPGNGEISFEYAQYLRQHLHLEMALKVYRSVLDLDPRRIAALFGTAITHAQLGQYEQSHALFERMREVDPVNPIGFGPDGGVYLEQGDLASALLWLYRHTLLDSRDAEVFTFFARAYMDFEDFEAADRWLSWIEENSEPGIMTTSTRSVLLAYTGEIEPAYAVAATALREGAANRWASDALFSRVVQLYALQSDEVDSALALLSETHPGFFAPERSVNANNVVTALNMVQLLQTAGRRLEADQLLVAVFEFLQQPYAITLDPRAWRATARAEALALTGEKDAALHELQRVVDLGWRIFWRWETELNPNFAAFHDDPRFQKIVAQLRTSATGQAQTVAEMVKSGKIAAPPDGD